MKRYPFVLLTLVMLALITSGLVPHDRTTWWLETFRVMIAVGVLLGGAIERGKSEQCLAIRAIFRKQAPDRFGQRAA